MLEKIHGVMTTEKLSCAWTDLAHLSALFGSSNLTPTGIREESNQITH